MAQNEYLNKNVAYFSKARLDLISFIPNNSLQRILEIGAGGCDTLIEIKKRNLAKEVVGVELMPLTNTNQDNPLIDKLIIADLDKEKLELEHDYFDVIIAGDVFEHLIDPWSVVNDLSKFLKIGGIFIVSLPNIREISTLFKIIVKGSFQYDIQGGILDKTHLRFFCKKDAIDLLSTHNLNVINTEPAFLRQHGGKNKRAFANIITLRIFENFFSSQYLIVAQKIFFDEIRKK